jgi:hypothetical protein
VPSLVGYGPAVNFEDVLSRSEARYADGLARLPEEADARQRALVRVGNAANAAGLALLMLGRDDDAGAWFERAARRWRESWADAPPGSWGRPIGALKARILAGDWTGAEDDAHWTLAAGAADAPSPIGRYAAVLALLVLGRNEQARPVTSSLLGAEGFPQDVADALRMVAAGDDEVGYVAAVERVLESFEQRDEYLEDVPVADTVLVLQALAARRGLSAELVSPLLPART